MSDNSLKPRLVTAAIFACAVMFFAYAVFTRLHETMDSVPRLVKRVVIKPFNEQPMEDATREFQRFETDITTPTHIRHYSYYLYVPYAAQHTKNKFPLVLVLHNAKGYAYAAKYLAMGKIIYDHPAFILVPMLDQGTGWASPPPMSNNETPLEEYPVTDAVFLIQQLASRYLVDTTRIYVVGCSAGGIGAYAAARYFPDVFAAAVPISGIWSPEDAPNMTKTPLWIEHGEADTTIPPFGDFRMSKAIQDSGGSAMYTEFPKIGHECSWESFYNASIFDWMFKQQLKPLPGTDSP